MLRAKKIEKSWNRALGWDRLSRVRGLWSPVPFTEAQMQDMETE